MRTGSSIRPNPAFLSSRPSAEQLNRLFASQTAKTVVAAACGAGAVLAIATLLPGLRSRVQATAGQNGANSGLSSAAPDFQVEVADLNNRRWILKGGGEAGLPFSDAGSRRDSKSSASANRADSTKSDSKSASRANDNANSANNSTDAAQVSRSRIANTAELELARPRTAGSRQTAATQALPPSIFDGITPPMGSLTANLPLNGPAAPGPVQPQPASGRPGPSLSAQSAVLLERVAPVYPQAALRAHVKGDVRVHATIGKDGAPTDLKVINVDERLVDAALAAIRQWRYRPATLDGQPVETQTVITVSFNFN